MHKILLYNLKQEKLLPIFCMLFKCELLIYFYYYFDIFNRNKNNNKYASACVAPCLYLCIHIANSTASHVTSLSCRNRPKL